MCLASSPSIQQQSASSAANKPLAILRNPYLDGTDPIVRARSTGLNGLRVDRTPPPGITAPTPSAQASGLTAQQLMQSTVTQMTKFQISPQQAAMQISRGVSGA